MLIGNINTIPSIVNLPGQGNVTDQGAAFRFQRTTGGWFEPALFNTNLGVGTNLGISCWVKIDQEFFDPNTTGGNLDYYIVDKYGFSGGGLKPGYRLFLRSFTDGRKQLKFTGVQETAGNIDTGEVSLDVSTLQADTAYLLTATCSGVSSGQLRAKGVGVSLVQNQNNFVNPNPGPGAPLLAIANANPVSPNQGFAGVIDEIAIWPDGTQIDDEAIDRLFNWPEYKDLMNSDPIGDNRQPRNWFRMGENSTVDIFGRIVIPNEGSNVPSQTLVSEGSPSPVKVVPGIPNELYN